MSRPKSPPGPPYTYHLHRGASTYLGGGPGGGGETYDRRFKRKEVKHKASMKYEGGVSVVVWFFSDLRMKNWRLNSTFKKRIKKIKMGAAIRQHPMCATGLCRVQEIHNFWISYSLRAARSARVHRIFFQGTFIHNKLFFLAQRGTSICRSSSQGG